MARHAINLAQELSAAPERKIVGVIYLQRLWQLIRRHGVALHQVMRVLQQSSTRRSTYVDVGAVDVGKRLTDRI